MKTYLGVILLIVLFNSSVLEAQTDILIRKKDFKNDKTGLKEAWKHVQVGDAYYSEKGIWYGNAYDEYLKAIVYNNSNPELNYKMGVAALFSDNKEEAAGFLMNAFEHNNNVTEDILLLTGRALQFSGSYTEAIVKLESFLNLKGKKSEEKTALAQKWLGECRSALLVTRDTLRIEIKNIGPEINSNADDYSEILTNDGHGMFFASRREMSKSSSFYKDSKFDENILFSVMNSGKWGPAKTAGKNITTKFCETPLFINNTGDKLYLYSGYKNGGDIMMSGTNKKGEWKVPEEVPFGINTSGSETSFTFSPSGNEIYFVTDKYKKGGFGGKDIFYIRKLNEKKWSGPENAGNIINTPYDEESVRFSRHGDTLWFSSKGHNSIGGFDIFYSVKNTGGAWDSVRNCGYPVNTPWDELFYNPSPVDDSLFYFVSNRSGGIGGMDIYEGRILPPDTVILAAVEPVSVVQPKPDTVIIRDTVVVVKEVRTVVEPAIQPEPTERTCVIPDR